MKTSPPARNVSTTAALTRSSPFGPATSVPVRTHRRCTRLRRPPAPRREHGPRFARGRAFPGIPRKRVPPAVDGVRGMPSRPERRCPAASENRYYPDSRTLECVRTSRLAGRQPLLRGRPSARAACRLTLASAHGPRSRRNDEDTQGATRDPSEFRIGRRAWRRSTIRQAPDSRHGRAGRIRPRLPDSRGRRPAGAAPAHSPFTYRNSRRCFLLSPSTKNSCGAKASATNGVR